MLIIARKHITPRRRLYRARIALESYSNRARIAIVIGPLVVTHQLQVERRTGKVRQSETDVLPLCRAVYGVIKNKICLDVVGGAGAGDGRLEIKAREGRVDRVSVRRLDDPLATRLRLVGVREVGRLDDTAERRQPHRAH